MAQGEEQPLLSLVSLPAALKLPATLTHGSVICLGGGNLILCYHGNMISHTLDTEWEE